MGRTATIALREHVDDEVMLRIARAMMRTELYRPPGFLDDGGDDGDDVDEEELLFGDHTVRTGERGFYVFPEEECRSRRVDLRGPTDRDPGPLEALDGNRPPDPDEQARAIVLRFRR